VDEVIAGIDDEREDARERDPGRPLEVGEFYELLTERLESAYGRRHPRWVRGEIAKVYEKSHLYVDLVDAGSSTSAKRPVLGAHCWASQWQGLKRRLAADGVTLEPGRVVNLFGYVDLYAPSGRVGFTVIDVDVAALMGDVARRRAELIARLRAEGLLEANRTRPFGPVPLRVGLVASPQSEGYNDFTGQLLGSGLAFQIVVAPVTVQGERAAGQLLGALRALDEAALDVIALVRGGGSKGDLAAFDDEALARGIAAARTPVVTGIGHTGDESVADLVAHHHAITPTKLGEELVVMVTQWRRRHVVDNARRLDEAASALVDEAEAYLGERRRTVIFAVRDRLRAEARHLGRQREWLSRQSGHVLERAAQSLTSARRLLEAYDPARRLAQGWSIVTREDGTVVRARGDVAEADLVRVRVSDGSFAARVLAEREWDATTRDGTA
jgi:exodeoxyribonuclease VII large subunit